MKQQMANNAAAASELLLNMCSSLPSMLQSNLQSMTGSLQPLTFLAWHGKKVKRDRPGNGILLAQAALASASLAEVLVYLQMAESAQVQLQLRHHVPIAGMFGVSYEQLSSCAMIANASS